MSVGRILFVACSLLLIAGLAIGGLGRPAWALDDEEDSLYKYLTVFTEVLKLARTVYVEDLDLRPLMAGALDGAGDALDPFSVFVPKTRVSAYEQAREIGRSHSGIMLLRERGVAFVAALDRGSPAEAAGLRRDDVISELDGFSTRDMPMWQVAEILTRPAGSKVEMEVVRQGEAISLNMELGSYDKPKPELQTVDEYAVLRIPLFDESTAGAVAALLGEVGDRPLVLDVRGASDRTPHLGFAVASLFVGGELGSLEGRDESLQSFTSDVESVQHAAGEVSVLTDRGSMGAAEVLAAVLHQTGRANTVGRRTFGHVGRSSLIPLSSGDVLEITDAFYAVPSGEKITSAQEPDLEVEGRFFRVVLDPGSDDAAAESYAQKRARRDQEVLAEALRLLRAEREEPLKEAA